MPGKLNVYNLGDLGVDLVSSPLHSPDGTFVQAQNVLVDPNQAEHGLSKRPGMTKLTSAGAAAGALLAIAPIPFFDPSSPGLIGTVLVRRVNTTDAEYTTDGVTWIASAGLFQASPSNYPSTLQNRTVPRLYYVTTGGLICYLSGNPPANTQVDTTPALTNGHICAVDTDELYFVSQNLIYLSDGATNTLICENPWDGAGVPGKLIKFDGNLYCGSSTSGASGKIYRYDGGTTWTEEAAFTDVNTVSKFAVFHGRLYACLKVTGSPDGAIDKIVVREGGAWRAVHNATGDFHGLCAFNEQLFVVRDTGAATEVWFSTDGETFILDEDLNASFTVGAREADLVAWNGNLYCLPATKPVYKRTTAGVWSESDPTAPLGIVMGAY